MLPKARERLVVELLTRLHRYVRDSDAAAPIASYFEAYDPLSTGAVSIPAFRNALSSFRAPQFCLSTNDMQILAAHYSFGGDPSMISYLSLLDDMSKTPHHLEASWRKASASTKGSSSLIRLEKLERLRGELCMLQQKKLAIIAGLALQAKQGVRAYHSAIGEPPGSLAFTQMSGKRRDEVRKAYNEAIKVAESQASEQELTMVKVAQAMDTIAMHACPSCLDTDFGFGLAASTDWESELKLVDERIIVINSAIAATAVGTPPQTSRSAAGSPTLMIPRIPLTSPAAATLEATGPRTSPTRRTSPGQRTGRASASISDRLQHAEQVALVRALALGTGEDDEPDL